MSMYAMVLVGCVCSEIPTASSSLLSCILFCFSFFFFFNDTATTEIYTLSLHDALPISCRSGSPRSASHRSAPKRCRPGVDRKSTRLNSSHRTISYAVFCLKKKKHDVGQRKQLPETSELPRYDSNGVAPDIHALRTPNTE